MEKEDNFIRRVYTPLRSIRSVTAITVVTLIISLAYSVNVSALGDTEMADEDSCYVYCDMVLPGHIYVEPAYPNPSEPGTIYTETLDPFDGLIWEIDWAYDASYKGDPHNPVYVTVTIEIIVVVHYWDYHYEDAAWETARTQEDPGYSLRPTVEYVEFPYGNGVSGSDSGSFTTIQETKAMYVDQAFAVNVTANVYYDYLLAGTNSGTSYYRLSYDSNPADEYRGSCTYNDQHGDDNDEITCTPNGEGYYERFEMSVDEYGDVHFKASISITDFNGGNTVYTTDLTLFAYEPKDYKKIGNGEDGNRGEGVDDPRNNGHWRPFTEEEIENEIPWKPSATGQDSWPCNLRVENEEREVEAIVPNMPARQIVYFKVVLECVMTPGIGDLWDTNPNSIPPTVLGIVYVEPIVEVGIDPP